MKKSLLNRLQLLAKLLAFVGVIAILSRCGKTSAPASGTFASVYNSISTSNCTNCHKPNGSALADAGVTLDLTTSAAAYSGLTSNNQMSRKTLNCSSLKLVAASQPTKSFMLGILFQDLAIADFGGATGCQPNFNDHHLGINLTADEETSFVNWVKNGALNN